ncbi:MAG: 50S ribosomal protein L1, partial [Chloroflexota bacterium]
DKTGNLHFPIGKASFTEQALLENAQTAYDVVLSHRPNGMKGVYIGKMVVTSTMGPGIKVNG